MGLIASLACSVERIEVEMMDEATRITDQGIAYYQQGNFDLAFQSFSQAAQMGNLLAMHNLAVCYSYGQGT